jgi:hypothetical protein
MATVTSYTAQRMKEIEDSTIVGGSISGNDLLLTGRDGRTINAGNVRGPQGIQGPQGVTSIAVCTSTTRPTGINLFTGLGIWETDTKRFYIYDGTAWVYKGGTVICTSSTRPTSPPIGIEIFETDTGWTWIYTGTVWLPTRTRELGYAERTTSAGPVGTTSAAIGGMSISFTLATTRRVKFEAFVRHFMMGSPPEYGQLEIRKQDNTVIQNGLFVMASVAGGSYVGSAISLSRTISLAAGSYTFSLWCGAVYGTVSMINASPTTPMVLSATDVGQ